MFFNKLKPVLRFLLCVLLCFCLCCSMFILRPVEVKANPLLPALTAVSIFVSFFMLFGWSVEVGDDLGAMMRESGVADKLFNRIGSGAENLWHLIIGDLAEWHYEKYGYLHPVSEWDGYYIDDNGNLMNSKYFVENPTDIAVGIDWDQYEQDSTLPINIDSNLYTDIWFEVQEFMHSSDHKYLSDLVQEVSSEPTLSELRNSSTNLYLGSVAYYGKDQLGHNPETTSVYTFKTDKINVEFCDYFFRHDLKYDGNIISISLYDSKYYNDWIPSFYVYFNEKLDNGYSIFDLYDNDFLTEEICKGKWGVSLPYKVIDSDGNVNTYMYLFSYLSDIVIKSGLIEYITANGKLVRNSLSEYIELFDEHLDYYVYSCSSDNDDNDDLIRSSATANQYAGTVNTGDDDNTYTPVTAPGQAGTIPVTGTGSLVNPVTGVNGNDYANGTTIPLSGTVTGSLTLTQTDTGVKSEVNSVVSSATVDYPEGFDSWQPSIKLFTKFPFCIPYDLYSCFAILYKDPKELYFEIPFKISSLSLDEKVVIDLRKFDSLVLIVRYLSLIGFVVFLTLKTRDLIKG